MLKKNTMEKLSGIYMILNTVNGHMYIGSSKDIESRWYKHIWDLKKGNHNPHFQAAWNKYGEENFQTHILEECTESELITKEQFWFDNAYPEYNGSNIAGRVEMTPALKKRLSEAQLKLCKDPKEIEFRSNKAKEQWASIPDVMSVVLERMHAANQRIREERKAAGLSLDRLTPEQHIEIGNKNKGRKNTTKSRQQMSDSHKGVPWTEKQYEAAKRSWTPERRKLFSDRAKAQGLGTHVRG